MQEERGGVADGGAGFDVQRGFVGGVAAREGEGRVEVDTHGGELGVLVLGLRVQESRDGGVWEEIAGKQEIRWTDSEWEEKAAYGTYTKASTISIGKRMGSPMIRTRAMVCNVPPEQSSIATLTLTGLEMKASFRQGGCVVPGRGAAKEARGKLTYDTNLAYKFSFRM